MNAAEKLVAAKADGERITKKLIEMQARLGTAKHELSMIDAARAEAFKWAILESKPFDGRTWALDKLQLENEIADLPIVIEAMRRLASSASTAVARASEAAIDADMAADAAEKRRRIEELIEEGVPRENIAGLLDMTREEFRNYAPPVGGYK